MPTYDFYCDKCSQTVTVTASMSDLRTPECLKCLTLMKRNYNFQSIKFNGSGFYATDKREDSDANY